MASQCHWYIAAAAARPMESSETEDGLEAAYRASVASLMEQRKKNRL
ncbi:hypothetical protein ACT691_09800 [Vibrio metschnikovii]